MSFTILPRLHFKGRFETDVCTANNDDIVTAIDQVNVAVQFGANGVPDTDAEFIAWMREEAVDDAGNGRGVPRASWNYYGGNSCGFLDCKIVAADLGNGLLTSAAADPSIGASVILGRNPDQGQTGVMVDLNPEGTWGTQIFADLFQVVSGAVRLEGPPTIAASRWLHFGRNVAERGFTGAAATWQSCLPANKIELSQGASGALLELFNVARAHRGLVVRYCTYHLSPVIPRQDILQHFNQGLSPVNPAQGIVVGSIGVWEDGDYASMPNGRLLLPRGSFSWDHGPMTFGPATIGIDQARGKAVLDLITMVPEVSSTGAKVPAGAATLLAFPDGAGAPVSLGQFPYDQATYETGGGLVEMSLTPQQVAAANSGTLAIRFGISGSSTLLRESVLAVDTDDRNIYLEQDASRQITVRVKKRGASPGEPITLSLAQYLDPTGKSETGPIAEADLAVSHPNTVTTDAHGIATFTITARTPMLGAIHAVVNGDTSSASPTSGCIINFRIFPADDYSSIPDADLTFAFIYQEVLRYYHVLYPAMTRRFSLADEQQVVESADAILARINPANWHRWGFMPRTREMSAGKRELLTRWLNKVLA